MKNINPVEFHATDHAIQRLNERFTLLKMNLVSGLDDS